MKLKPFLKWAGGKRWLVNRDEFAVPSFDGRYIEPFLGSGAVFFHVAPESAILSDRNARLMETYQAIQSDWNSVLRELESRAMAHSDQFYYQERQSTHARAPQRAAQFIYLNRTCWNGLYRENLNGQFNVPRGTKTTVIFEDDDFESISESLSGIELASSDFEKTINMARSGDFLFIDPPYTTAHNMNGFVKYNQTIFSWNDQVRLSKAIRRAADRGCKIALTNAAHESIYELYRDAGQIIELKRPSIISGNIAGRKGTTEILIRIGFSS